MIVPSGWYPVLEAIRVAGRPVGVKRFGRRLVLWRGKDGAVHAMDERCPHRGAALSDGHVQDNAIACPFHGFEYGADGACQLMPCEGATARIPGGLQVQVYPLREEHEILWLWWGEERAQLPRVPWFDEFGDEAGAATGSFDWPCNYVRSIETNFDFHHLPFVHRRVVKSGHRLDPYHVEVDKDHIKTQGTLRHENEPSGIDFRIEFKAPSVSLITLSAKALGLSADCPIDEANTWRCVRVQQRYTSIPGVRLALSWLALQAEWKLFQNREDLKIIEKVEPRLPHEGKDHLVRADAGTAAFLNLHRRLLDEARTGTNGSAL